MQLIPSLVAAGALVACTAAATPSPSRNCTMATENAQLVRRLYTEYLNTGAT